MYEKTVLEEIMKWVREKLLVGSSRLLVRKCRRWFDLLDALDFNMVVKPATATLI